MKRVNFLLILLLITLLVKAQEQSGANSDEMTTLFGKGGKPSIGWVIGIDPGYTRFDNKDVWLGGMTVGMVLDHNFTIGLTGRGWVNRDGMYYPQVTDSAGAYLEGGYGGLLLEYTLFPKSVIHVTFPLLIGGGGASYISDTQEYEWDEDEWDDCHENLDTDGFFVIEPGVRAEVNVLKFMRFNVGVSYRYVNDLELINTPKTMMNNFTATVGLKFGKF